MRNKKVYFFLLPALLLLCVFVILPMLQIFYFSLLKYNLFEESKFVFLKNYISLFADSNFRWTLLNSLIYILVTPVIMFLSLFLALLMRQAGRYTKYFRAALFLPVVTPVVIVGIIWRWIYSEDTGLLNYFVSIAGIKPVHWLTNYPLNIISIMFVVIWRGMGYYMMLFLAGLAVIPKEQEEASVLDGANRFQQIFYIIVPMLKPTLILVFVTSATAAIKMFTEIYTILPGAPMNNKALVSYLYQQSFERFDFGKGSAVGVILFLLTFVFSYINIKMMEREA